MSKPQRKVPQIDAEHEAFYGGIAARRELFTIERLRARFITGETPEFVAGPSTGLIAGNGSEDDAQPACCGP